MDFSDQQQVALRRGEEFLSAPYDEKKPWLYVAGFAGTGKTTIAKYLAEQSGLDVRFAAYTGKAAYVMRRKGCTGTRTIHSLIYVPAGESKGEQLRKVEQEIAKLKFDPPRDLETKKRMEEQLEARRQELLRTEKRKPMFSLNMDSELCDADALVVDEVSMVDEQMARDLLSFRKKIVVLGDPMQLPPVGSAGYFTKGDPDVLLTEIHRQARESGILRLATDVRLTGGYSRRPGYYGDDCLVARKQDIDEFQRKVLLADQLLVGKNATRHSHNARYRELTERSGKTPVAGDKVVCLRNDHRAGFLNGSLWRVHESTVDEDSSTVEMTLSSEEDGGSGLHACAWTHHFLGQEQELNAMRWKRQDNQEFDYGYALTVHKAQGSQWDDVVLFDESWVFRNEAQRWLYTGVTRAAKKLTVVLT